MDFVQSINLILTPSSINPVRSVNIPISTLLYMINESKSESRRFCSLLCILHTKYKYTPLSPRPNWDSPIPSPASECVPPEPKEVYRRGGHGLLKIIRYLTGLRLPLKTFLSSERSPTSKYLLYVALYLRCVYTQYRKMPIFRTPPPISDKSCGFTAFLATGKVIDKYKILKLLN
jgi:hypothetical protein